MNDGNRLRLSISRGPCHIRRSSGTAVPAATASIGSNVSAGTTCARRVTRGPWTEPRSTRLQTLSNSRLTSVNALSTSGRPLTCRRFLTTSSHERAPTAAASWSSAASSITTGGKPPRGSRHRRLRRPARHLLQVGARTERRAIGNGLHPCSSSRRSSKGSPPISTGCPRSSRAAHRGASRHPSHLVAADATLRTARSERRPDRVSATAPRLRSDAALLPVAPDLRLFVAHDASDLGFRATTDVADESHSSRQDHRPGQSTPPVDSVAAARR